MKTRIIFKSAFPVYIALMVMLFGTCSKKGAWLEAVVVNLGSPAVDGCGFLLEIENQIYYPINLEEKYQIDGKRVRVRYIALEEMYTCGFPHADTRFQKIDIREIKGQ